MSGFWERYFIINRKTYWESDLRKNTQDSTLYYLNGRSYTPKQLEGVSSTTDIGYTVAGYHYTKKWLESTLSCIEGPYEDISVGGIYCGKQEIKDILNLPRPPKGIPDDPPASKEVAKESGDNHDPPETVKRISPDKDEEKDDDDDDELIAKVLANLKAKTILVKRHKEVAAEAKRLRRLLAEKDAEIAEYEKVMALEAEQVE